MRAAGSFDVDLRPLEAFATGEDGTRLGRLSIVKSFRGGLVATSRGEMLSAMTATEGSAGYVAIEQVRGTLEGKEGTFVLQHFGVMRRGVNRLVLEVTPDSGTGDLSGLSGTMQIDITGDQHTYTFEYALDL